MLSFARRPALPLLLLLAGACRTAPPPQPVATVTIGEPGAAAETWEADAAAGVHVHPLSTRSHCGELDAAGQSPAMHALVSQTCGAAYGGPGRLTLVLRRPAGAPDPSDRGLLVVVPELRPDEPQRTFQDAEIQADLHDPLPTVVASLETGTVRVRRLDRHRYAVDLRLTLRSPAARRVQICATTEASTLP
jgi:hypothetical protein